MTFYERLLALRAELQENGIAKSGVNQQLENTYFKLDDILTAINPLLVKHKILDNIEIDYINHENLMRLTLEDATGKEPDIVHRTEIPMVINEPIINKSGKSVNSRVQDLGSSYTYLKRQLYMTAFMIADTHDNDGEDIAKGDFMAEKRNAATEEMKSKNASASVMKALKVHAGKLKELSNGAWDEGYEKLKSDTEDFAKMSNQASQELIVKLMNRIKELEAEASEEEPPVEEKKTTTRRKKESKEVTEDGEES